MRHDLDAALDQCLIRLSEGADLHSCLARYPEYADELRPLLKLAVEVAHVRLPAAPVDVRAAGQRRMLAALAQKQERQATVHPAARFAKRLFWSLVPRRPRNLRLAWQLVAVMSLFVLLAGGGMMVNASADSLPGDLLYPVKLVSQKAQLSLTLDPVNHRIMEDRFDSQQRLDVQAVLKGQRQVAVEFQGVLQELEDDLWIVGGLPVVLQETTIVGQPYLGAVVQVQADLPGNGELVANRLRVESTMTPEPTEPMQVTPTPAPTKTSEPTQTERPTRTSEPTTAVEATGTPEPDDAPESKDAPDPTETPEPDDEPERKDTPDPTETPESDDEPEHKDAPDPTETPEPDDAPERKDTPEGDDDEHKDAPEGDDEHKDAPEPDDDEHKDTPDHAETPEPDDDEHKDAPDPTETPEPDDDEHKDTPEPDDEHKDRSDCTETPEPDDAPEHKGTPDPDDTPEHKDSSDSKRTPESEDTPEDHHTPEPTRERDD